MAKKTPSAAIDKAIDTLRGVVLDDLGEAQAKRIVELGVDLINKDYWADVRGVAKDLLRQIKDGEIKTREGLDDALNQDIDSTQRVIYTFEAKLGMLATNNPDAWEEFGFEHPTVEQMMFCAMKEDVTAQLQAEGAWDLVEDD
jgi:hypothetical protein